MSKRLIVLIAMCLVWNFVLGSVRAESLQQTSDDISSPSNLDSNEEEFVAQACYFPYSFSIVNSSHFVYWFSYRPASYNAYMAGIPIYAQPYGSNGILVQKRDICWLCNCNPWCALLWTYICAK